MAYQAHKELVNGNPDAIGEMLDESWQVKKQLASQISNDGIDEKYMAARRAGALGGKLSGAGGGGSSCCIRRMRSKMLCAPR
jgi:D-glycero-alpha-D-manno-heptose-7-phosphate kinase